MHHSKIGNVFSLKLRQTIEKTKKVDDNINKQ